MKAYNLFWSVSILEEGRLNAKLAVLSICGFLKEQDEYFDLAHPLGTFFWCFLYEIPDDVMSNDAFDPFDAGFLPILFFTQRLYRLSSGGTTDL